MSFLSDLGDQLSSQFNVGENHTTSLDTFADEAQTINIKYGALGDFATKFDQSAERRYVEEGYLRRDPYNTDPKQFDTLWQQPDATVLVKKRMFSSIAENYRPDFMDADERLYYKAMKILMQNKCTQISALEKLSKIQKITAAVGNVNEQLVPLIITLADTATGNVFNSGTGGAFGGGNNLFGLFPGGNPFTTQDASNFIKTVDRLRTLQAFNRTNAYTTWITDPTNLFQSIFGAGTGTIELTNFTKISTTTTTDIKSPGRFSLSITDPYESMLITDYDIEVALSDATNLFYNSKIFQFGANSSNQVLKSQQNQLNKIRNARNASPITFKVEPDTLLGKRVRAIIDRLGVEIQFTFNPLGALSLGGNSGVKVDVEFIKGGEIAGFDGLDDGPGYTGFPWKTNAKSKSHGNSELQAFQSIVSTIYSQLTLLQNAAGNFTADNQSYNYARRKLRFNFSGKLIIQPMDVVHIYMKSRSQFDNKILSGLTQMFSGFGILQNINNTATGFKNELDTLFNPSKNVAVTAEKNMFVGPSFPNYLWATMRGQFTNENEGTHVFGGVVEAALDNWSGGRFTVDISGSDNSLYFRQGKVNFKPGANNFNGMIFDPLTPFVSNFDSITTNGLVAGHSPQLLDENLYLLSQTGAGSLAKYKLGSLAGQKATQGNYIQDQSIDPTTGRLTRVFYAPDGLVYKWKQGIGVFVQNGSINTINDPNMVGLTNPYQQPFAGLDVMNVLSLLITGIPYNYATYFRTTQNLYGITGDPQSKQDPSYSFINSLRSSLSKTNALWGNFIPFKNLVMSDAAIAKSMQAQATITQKNSDLDKKIQELANVQNTLVSLGAVNALSTSLPSQISAVSAAKAKDLQAKAKKLREDINESIKGFQAATKQFFGQVSTSPGADSNYLLDGKNNPSDSKGRKELRKQTNYLTRRMSYDVRGNSDKNLFIVDDYYDIDYDIAAFNKALAKGAEMYSTEYSDVSTQISHVADLLNLEVFCDSQGHIRVRPPQYNRMPSSVFNRMMYLKKALGVQIFPEFLNSMFEDQINTLRNRIEVIEDQIRLDCAILGAYKTEDMDGDKEAMDFIKKSLVNGGTGGLFQFVSDSSGNISDVQNLILAANQDTASAATPLALSNFDAVKSAGTSNNVLFSSAEKYYILREALQQQNLKQEGSNTSSAPSTSIFQQSVVQSLIIRIQTKSGQYISSKDYLTQGGPNSAIELDTGKTIDVFKVTNELSTYMQEWQAAVKLFYHTIKNSVESRALDNGTVATNALLNPGNFKKAFIPEVFEHMIEDESYDDYGPGSGHRYVIRRSQIRSLRIGERAPPYTSVEVHGTLPFFSENEGGGGPPGLNNFPGGGNGLVTAIALDYDMWRNYGFKQGYTINVPFLTDPSSQLGPYAAIILSRDRHSVLSGQLTISGNEYMQPGEVIFLEDRNMLFYVSSVSHSLDMGSNFTTTLELTYGHGIGEYIPTIMDSIGKLIYKNQEIADMVIHRQDSSANEESIGVIQLGSNTSAPLIPTGQDSNLPNPFTTTNTKVYNRILYNSQYIINLNGASGNNVKAHVELRVYYDKSNPVNSQLVKQANGIMNQLTDPNGGGPTSISYQNQPVKNPSLPRESVKVVSVDLDNEKSRLSPSQYAIDAARGRMATTSTNTGSTSSSNPTGKDDGTNSAAISANNNALRKALFSYIIDCWVSFEQVPAAVANSTTT